MDFEAWATAVDAVIGQQLDVHVESDITASRAEWTGPANRCVATRDDDGIRIVVRYARGAEQYFAEDRDPAETGTAMADRLSLGV